jgi:hypothetical protein
MYRNNGPPRDEAVQQSSSVPGQASASMANDNNAAAALTQLANAAATQHMSPRQAYHPGPPPVLQPSFNPSHHTPASPSNGVPSMSSGIARGTPTRTYDPIRDAGESSTTPRGTTRYDPMGHEVYYIFHSVVPALGWASSVEYVYPYGLVLFSSKRIFSLSNYNEYRANHHVSDEIQSTTEMHGRLQHH